MLSSKIVLQEMSKKSRFCQTKKQQLHFGLVNPDWIKLYLINCTISAYYIRRFSQKMKFSIKDFFSRCGQIRRRLWIWSHSLKKSLMKTSFFMQWKMCTYLFLAYRVRPFFFIKSAREALCVIRQFLPANIFEIFLFDSPSFINTNFNVRNSWFYTVTVH